MTTTAFVLRNEDGHISVDENNYMTCVTEDETNFLISAKDVDFTSDKLICDVAGTSVVVDLTQIPSSPQTNKKDLQFSWNDNSTRMFLALYKEKRDLVTTRKIKTLKQMWKQISEAMICEGYNLTSLQVENKFKSMERAFKNVRSNNKKTGRGRITCNFEQELTELFANKHNITPLAISGREGLVMREDVSSLSTYDASRSNQNPVVQSLNVHAESTTRSNPVTVLPSSAACETIEPASVIASTSRDSESDSSLILNTQRLISRKRSTPLGSTANLLNKCHKTIEAFHNEIKEQKDAREQILKDILEEQKQSVQLQKEFLKSTIEQRLIANKQREERNNLLKQLLQLRTAQNLEK